jgi:N-formylglutamate amidohydrolase
LKARIATSFLFVLLLVVAAATDCRAQEAETQQPSPDQTAAPESNPDGFVIYERGNMPVILLAPHGGTVRPEGMPVLTKYTGRDVNTDLMARAIAAALTYEDEAGVTRKPHLVINRLHRKYSEPNRSWKTNLERGWIDADGEPADPDPRAVRVFEDFHAFADFAVRTVQREHGSGLLLDIHGLAASRPLDMYGYLLKSADFRESEVDDTLADDEQLAAAILERSTLRAAASRKKSDAEIAGLVRGEKSLASLMNAAYARLYPDLVDEAGNPSGNPAIPSKRFPDPKGEAVPGQNKIYFNGAYDVAAHSSFQDGVAVDAVQIEITADDRRNKAARQRFAQAMAEAVREFLALHYDYRCE